MSNDLMELPLSMSDFKDLLKIYGGIGKLRNSTTLPVLRSELVPGDALSTTSRKRQTINLNFPFGADFSSSSNMDRAPFMMP